MMPFYKNTVFIKHYMVKDGNVMALMYKEDDDDSNGKKLLYVFQCIAFIP
jgi:hypothetical protein